MVYIYIYIIYYYSNCLVIFVPLFLLILPSFFCFYLYLDLLSFPLPSFFLTLLTAPGDYQGIDKKLTFSPSNTSHMVSLSIVDDNLVEFNEEFSVLLTTPVNDVIPSQPSTSVLIINNDGVCFCVCTCTLYQLLYIIFVIFNLA